MKKMQGVFAVVVVVFGVAGVVPNSPVMFAEEVVTEPILTFSGHTDSVWSVAFSPNGAEVLTGSYDNTARLWNATTGQHIRTFISSAGTIFSVAFSPDGTMVVAGSAGTTLLWNATTGGLVGTFEGHTSYVASVCFSPDGTKLVTGSGDRTARLWDIETGLHLQSYDGHTKAVWSVAFSPCGNYVLTGSHDGIIRLFDAADGNLIRYFLGHSDGIGLVVFSTDGTRILSGSHDRTARLWDTENGRHIRTFSGHASGLDSVAFARSGSRIATGSRDNTARLWNASTGEHIRTFSGHTSWVHSVAFSPDGAKLLTGSPDQTAKLWAVPPELAIRSTPITGVSITGDAAGVTDFSRVLDSGDTITLTAPSIVFDGAVRYDFVRWIINDVDQPQWQESVNLIADRSIEAVAVYEIWKHTLAVNSEPVPGISITGDAPGTTAYSASIDDQSQVELTAPLIASINNTQYGFIRWVVNGTEHQRGQRTVAFTMDDDITATAEYFPAAKLTVFSTPFGGMHLEPGYTGLTPYTRTYYKPQTVTFSARMYMYLVDERFLFEHWIVNGVPRQKRLADIQVRVESDTTVEAVYKPVSDDCRADLNNDGKVDVLDLVYVRNRLGAICEDHAACFTISPEPITTADAQVVIYINSRGASDDPPDVVNLKLNGTTVLANVVLNKWHWSAILDLKPDDVNNVEVEYVFGGSNNCVSADVVLGFFPSGEQQLGSLRLGPPVGNKATWIITRQ